MTRVPADTTLTLSWTSALAGRAAPVIGLGLLVPALAVFAGVRLALLQAEAPHGTAAVVAILAAIGVPMLEPVLARLASERLTRASGRFLDSPAGADAMAALAEILCARALAGSGDKDDRAARSVHVHARLLRPWIGAVRLEMADIVLWIDRQAPHPLGPSEVAVLTPALAAAAGMPHPIPRGARARVLLKVTLDPCALSAHDRLRLATRARALGLGPGAP